MARIVVLLLISALLAGCAKHQDDRFANLPAFYKTHPACIGAGRDAVRMWRCRPLNERVAFAEDYTYFEANPGILRGTNAVANVRTLRSRGDVVVLAKDVKTGEVCIPQYRKSYVLSRDNANGEMRIPASCSGKRFEFVWHLEGEFDRYEGLRVVRGSATPRTSP